jgi:seryl-tRNA synthetase
MRRETRIKILSKLAKKDSKLGGRSSRKEVEKYLSNAKKVFDKATSEKRALVNMISSMQAKLDGLREAEDSAKKDMNLCHGILRKMDFTNAKEVRVGKDSDDVAYSVDGKWCSYDDNTGELSKYEKKKKEDSEDVSDSDDDSDDELLEGVDITI